MADAGLTVRGTKRARPSPRPRLVEQDADAPIQLERRCAERQRARGHGVATFVDPDGRLCLTRVSLVDRSESGLGVRAPVPVAPGATFTLAIDGAFAHAQGVVAHIRARGGTYRLGLRIARRMAA